MRRGLSWEGQATAHDKGAGVPCGVNAGEEERCDLWEHLAVAERSFCAGVPRAQQQVRKGAAHRRRGMDVLQQRLDDGLLAAHHMPVIDAC